MFTETKYPRIKLCIGMITYNHESFISAAIDSVLNQVTDFDFQIIIGEDKSSDQTGAICKAYATKFPQKIKLITSEDNIGMMKNFIRTYSACDGEYIAFIEGDDYWTDPLKLQKQVDFLDSEPGYMACFHNVVMKMERNGENREWILHEKLAKETFTTEDLIGPWFIPSASFLFRNNKEFHLPDWFYHCRSVDIPLMLLLSLSGKFKYLNEVMSVYRLHDAGVSNQHRGYEKISLMIFIYENFNIHTQYRFREKIKDAVMYEIYTHLPPDPNKAGESKRTKGYRMMKRLMTKLKIRRFKIVQPA